MRKTKTVLLILAVGILLIFLQPVAISRQLIIVEGNLPSIVSYDNYLAESFLSNHLIKIQPFDLFRDMQDIGDLGMIRGP